ncbi:MAG: 50S ribosomal protein L21 [Fimbriimonadaceae bacterium]|nr:50S ribosomal protein L21 [Fimbriimonadaceae bacterium]
MYALIESGGQQHKVEPGRYVTLKRLAVELGEQVTFDKVLLVRTDEAVQVGTPAVAEAKVVGTIRRHLRGKKVHVLKVQPKKGYRRHYGARANLTQVTIDQIVVGEATYTAPAAAEE